MTAGLAGERRHGGHGWRMLGWGSAVALLLLPAIAMRFTDEVNWGAEDFLFAGLLLGLVGLGLELAFRASRQAGYRLGAALALGNGLLILWANAAVGILGAPSNRWNLMFTGIVALVVVGAVLGRRRADRLAVTMLTAAGLQALALAIGLAVDPRGATLSAAFVVGWLLSATAFRHAARRGGR